MQIKVHLLNDTSHSRIFSFLSLLGNNKKRHIVLNYEPLPNSRDCDQHYEFVIEVY